MKDLYLSDPPFNQESPEFRKWLEAVCDAKLNLPLRGWVPVYTCNGAMTYTSVSTTFSSYIKVGPLVFFWLRASGTIGGVVNTTINVTPPATVSPSYDRILVPTHVADGGTWGAGFTAIDAVNNLLLVRKEAVSNYTAGTVEIRLSGFLIAA